MNNSFLTAAASYYGIDPKTASGDWQNEKGMLVLTFQYIASEQDIEGIISRMRTLKESQPSQPEPQIAQIITWDEAVALYGPAYDLLSADHKSKWGSRQRYIQRMVEMACEGSHIVTANHDVPVNRKVTHVDAPDDGEPVSMDAVWIPACDCSDAQKQFSSDYRCEPGHSQDYLIQWAMLTEEQKAQVADRSGGLPG